MTLLLQGHRLRRSFWRASFHLAHIRALLAGLDDNTSVVLERGNVEVCKNDKMVSW